MKAKQFYTHPINRTLSFKSPINANFIDNRPSAIVQAKMVKQISESGVIQGFWAVPIRERNNRLMSLDDFMVHKTNAKTYYTRARNKMYAFNDEDKPNFYPKTVACHGEAYTVCGPGRYFNSRHAEIQILDDCPDQDHFEIGITQDMCIGQYSAPSCQAAVTNSYDDKKAIFAQVPGHLYIFSIGGENRREVSENDKFEACEKCGSDSVTAYNLCLNCLNEEFEEARRREEDEQMEQQWAILHELEEDERREELERRMEEYSEIPTYEHKCENCGVDYESYDFNSRWCDDCIRSEINYY